MKATFPVFPVLILGLMVVPVCCGGQNSDLQEAMVMARQIREHTGGKAAQDEAYAAVFDKPKVAPKSPDTLDPEPLVVDSELIAILERRGACGDSTANAVWKVTREKVVRKECRGTGTGVHACKVHWSGAPPGETFGAQGNFLLTVVDRPTYDFHRGLDSSVALTGAGDDAFLSYGAPYVRVGDLAVTIENTTATHDLSIEILKAVARRMPK
jgi:hypothetical protein